MGRFLLNHMEEVRFLYGLIFFSLGFAIYLQPRRSSVYFLATALSWLGAFALVHALADWGLIFMPDGVSPLVRQAMAVRSLGVVFSYCLLLMFGLTLLFEHHPYRTFISLIPSGVMALFVFLVLMTEFGGTIASLTAAEVKILGRYLLGFPSALLSAWGLLRQVPALRRNKCPRLGHLYGAAVCFVLYGIVGGLIVPQGDLLLAGIINESSFLQLAGVPVEVARGLTMLGVTYYTVRLLDIFNLETQRRLQMAEQDRALLRERERIAGELHDGIMQTLYGTGLGLKQVTTLSRTQPDQAHAILTELNKEISRAILQMRRFVLDLKEHTISVAELVDAVRSQTSDIGQFAGIPIAFQQDLTECAAYAVPAGLREEVLALVREGLSNVVRHAQAGAARVVLGLDDDTVLVRVSDNGCGFDPVALESGRALDSLRERVEALGGFMQVHSTPGEGTDLVAHLPLTPGKRRGRTKEMTA